jgi:hypothetical protein
MNENHDQAAELSGTIVVQLEPYRERRRTRGRAAGFLLGYLLGAYVLPALAELVEAFLDTTEPSANGDREHVAAASVPDE